MLQREHSLSRNDDTIVVLISTCNKYRVAKGWQPALALSHCRSHRRSGSWMDASFLPFRDVLSLACVIVFQLSRGLRIAMGRRAVSVVGRRPMGEPLPMNVGIADRAIDRESRDGFENSCDLFFSRFRIT